MGFLFFFAEETEVASERHLDAFTHCLMQLRGTCNALICSYKCILYIYIYIYILDIKRGQLMFEINNKNEKIL